MSDSPTLSDFEKGILENVRAYGFQVNHVFADYDGDDPPFSYSIGFPESVGQPEVIVFGLSSTMMHSMICETFEQCRNGLVLSDKLVIEGLLEGHECVSKAVVPEAFQPRWFASAIWFEKHRTGDTMSRAFQIVWPAAKSRLFPWEDGCPDEVYFSQRPLYLNEGVV